jgi:hypothetical protein
VLCGVEPLGEGAHRIRARAGRYEGENGKLELGLSCHTGIVTQIGRENQTRAANRFDENLS